MIRCGFCPYTDGMCYTSNPPKRKCTITGEFHLYDDECNCEYSRLLKEKEEAGESLIEHIPDSAIGLNADGFIASDYDFPTNITDSLCEPITVACVPCLVCGESVDINWYEGGPKICNSCKEAIQFVKDNLMEKKND